MHLVKFPSAVWELDLMSEQLVNKLIGYMAYLQSDGAGRFELQQVVGLFDSFVGHDVAQKTTFNTGLFNSGHRRYGKFCKHNTDDNFHSTYLQDSLRYEDQ